MSSRRDVMPYARSIVVEQRRFASRSGEMEVAAASDCSQRHAVNEDAYSPLDRAADLYVVADGVGGGAMASWASRELVRRLHAVLDRRIVDAGAIESALLDADRELRRDIARETAYAGAATVALCASAGPSAANWLIAWVGDCRAYRVHANTSDPAELLTRDDTYERLGEHPPHGGSPHDPARMVGNGAVVAPNVMPVDLGEGEMLLLCSDGLHRHVDAAEIGTLLRSHQALARGCERLLALARSHSRDDDATLLVVHRRPIRRLAWMTPR
ncbi:MAG TPA: PP2C family serine/threonine-protein phosphatase [Casimicrobiaceae bacterium]